MAAARRRAPAWLRAFNHGDDAAIDAAFAPDVLVHVGDPLLPPLAAGVAGVRQLVATLRTAFPDLTLTVISDIGQGQTRVYTFAATGTHRGPFLRVRPTGRPVSFPGRFMIRHDDGGRAAELWVRTNLTGLVPQLGMGPTVVS